MEEYEQTKELKEIRKLRKVLRQIENLQLLHRELNDDEKLKISKRAVFREKLNQLNLKYSHLELESTGHTEFESSDFQSDTSNNNSFRYDDVKTESVEESDKKIENVIEKLNELAIGNNEEKKEQETVDKNKYYKLEPKITTIESKIEIKQVAKNTKKPSLASQIRFKALDLENVHEDLITTLDLCVKKTLLVTGSRDTSIKLWNFENGKLLHSFGGHTGAVSCVKFWSFKFYKKSLENIVNTVNQEEADYEEAKQLLDEINESQEECDENELLLSSSLDCSFRIWSINDGKCLKQFYLYNCVNNFDIYETSFAIALDAGKIEYWNNMIKECDLKAFDDFESVRQVQFYNSLVCALTANGRIKIFLVSGDGKPVLNLINEDCVSNIMESKNRHQFKYFAMLNDQIILMTNGQSYAIAQNLVLKNHQIISNNCNNYGISTCLCKCDNLVYVSAYNVDTGLSTINAFSITDGKLNYEFTFEDKANSNNYCISSVCFKNAINKTKYNSIMVTSANKSFKVWYITNDSRNRDGQTVRYIKLMSAKVLFSEEDDTDEDENRQSETNSSKSSDDGEKSEKEEREENKRKYCIIQ